MGKTKGIPIIDELTHGMDELVGEFSGRNAMRDFQHQQGQMLEEEKKARQAEADAQTERERISQLMLSGGESGTSSAQITDNDAANQTDLDLASVIGMSDIIGRNRRFMR